MASAIPIPPWAEKASGSLFFFFKGRKAVCRRCWFREESVCWVQGQSYSGH